MVVFHFLGSILIATTMRHPVRTSKAKHAKEFAEVITLAQISH